MKNVEEMEEKNSNDDKNTGKEGEGEGVVENSIEGVTEGTFLCLCQQHEAIADER